MSIVLDPKLEQRIAAKVESGQYKSADEVIAKGLDLLDSDCPAQPAPAVHDGRPIWEVIAEIGRSVPDEEWASLPADFSRNLRHYLYGAPKESE